MKIFLGYSIRVMVAAVLIAGLAFLYLKTYALDPAQREVTINLLRELRQIDADWNVEMLRSKAGLSNDYDAVTLPQRTSLQVLDRVREQGLGSFDRRLNDAEAVLRETIVAKIDLVDRFKAENAIMRNSLRFIPAAAADLRSRVREAEQAAPQKRAQLNVLMAGAEQILMDVLKLQGTAGQEQIRRVHRDLGALAVNRAEYPPAVAESFDIFAQHASKIAAQKEREGQLLVELGRLPLVHYTDALDSAFRTAFDRANAQREQYRTALFLYSGLLLALLAFLVARLVWRSRTLAAA